ncbi:hypothetical protein K438DRAFT_2164853, partial [Mycena galopus ATCC 62051]
RLILRNISINIALPLAAANTSTADVHIHIHINICAGATSDMTRCAGKDGVECRHLGALPPLSVPPSSLILMYIRGSVLPSGFLSRARTFAEGPEWSKYVCVEVAYCLRGPTSNASDHLSSSSSSSPREHCPVDLESRPMILRKLRPIPVRCVESKFGPDAVTSGSRRYILVLAVALDSIRFVPRRSAMEGRLHTYVLANPNPNYSGRAGAHPASAQQQFQLGSGLLDAGRVHRAGMQTSIYIYVAILCYLSARPAAARPFKSDLATVSPLSPGAAFIAADSTAFESFPAPWAETEQRPERGRRSIVVDLQDHEHMHDCVQLVSPVEVWREGMAAGHMHVHSTLISSLIVSVQDACAGMQTSIYIHLFCAILAPALPPSSSFVLLKECSQARDGDFKA